MFTSIATIHEASRAEIIELREAYAPSLNIHSDNNSTVVEGPSEDKRKRIRVGNLCYVTKDGFQSWRSWNDRTVGPLIPRMQTIYDNSLLERVPRLIRDGAAVPLISVLLGPMYPIVMNHSTRIPPPWLLSGCIEWIAGFRQAGTAIFPFITGAMAHTVEISDLQPMLVVMMGLMMVLWVIVPSERHGNRMAPIRYYFSNQHQWESRVVQKETDVSSVHSVWMTRNVFSTYNG
ncbi:hypothetical protein DFS33DRAFT_1274961 [Desarmillaria ectypa]|nr:hypothetical protein DFS33DRAFT_1274961 [Desarmillaria ectypa]